jgi:L-fuculose-phosphate aldolase
MLMRRHGALTQGKDLEEAFNRMEELEFQAHLQILVGRAKGLSRSEIEKIRSM